MFFHGIKMCKAAKHKEWAKCFEPRKASHFRIWASPFKMRELHAVLNSLFGLKFQTTGSRFPCLNDIDTAWCVLNEPILQTSLGYLWFTLRKSPFSHYWGRRVTFQMLNWEISAKNKMLSVIIGWEKKGEAKGKGEKKRKCSIRYRSSKIARGNK